MEGWWFLLPDKRIPAVSSTNHAAPCAGPARTCSPFPLGVNSPSPPAGGRLCAGREGFVVVSGGGAGAGAVCQQPRAGTSPARASSGSWSPPLQGPRGLPLSGHIPK